MLLLTSFVAVAAGAFLVLFAPEGECEPATMVMGAFSEARNWDLDIDGYLNRILPPSPLHKFPAPVSRFLGYRKEARQDVGNILGAFWSMLGAFCGLGVVAAVFNKTESIQWHHPPALIASFVSTRLCGLYWCWLLIL